MAVGALVLALGTGQGDLARIHDDERSRRRRTSATKMLCHAAADAVWAGESTEHHVGGCVDDMPGPGDVSGLGWLVRARRCVSSVVVGKARAGRPAEHGRREDARGTSRLTRDRGTIPRRGRAAPPPRVAAASRGALSQRGARCRAPRGRAGRGCGGPVAVIYFVRVAVLRTRARLNVTWSASARAWPGRSLIE